MANIAKKKLRAFKIENPNITQNDSGIIALMQQVLTQDSTAQSRRMKLNEEDDDEDLLSYFSWQQSNNYLFGMMLRIIPAKNGGVIPEEKFSQATISISELASDSKENSQYKEHYYFAMNNNYVVTDLSGTYSIDRFQTYLNWLLGEIRGERYFDINPVSVVPDGVKVSDIKSIEIGNARNSISASVSNEPDFTTQIKDITKSVLEGLFKDTDNLSDIEQEQLISAKLLIKIKKKPKDMIAEDYQRVMSAVTKQITNDSGITIKTKNGSYTGEAVKKIKEIEVEKTSGNKIVEEQLKQKMEVFLSELNNE